MDVETGQAAPDFTLFSSEKQRVALSALKGQPVVLLFFPLAFTKTCTHELCSVRDHITVYNQLTAKVFGISVDSVYVLAKYKEEQILNFPLLSDFNREVSKAYGCLYEDFSYGMKGVSKGASFVIDQDGIIRYREVLEDAGELPDFDGIVNALRAAN